MASVTGVELGPNYCVLVRAARHGSRTTAWTSRTIASDEWPEDPIDRVDLLREIKRSGHFPSRARIVQWRSSDARAGFEYSSFVRSLAEAGFEIEDTLAPGQALAHLVRDRRLQSDRRAVAAVALNTHGAVIAIVSDGAVISSRTFAWTLGKPFSGSHSELLERYLVISQLAPELEHIIELVRPVYGVLVGSVVLCGHLPNLRSLSMLLIEELDIEVETLDASDVFDASSGGELFAESVAALQLAAAASVADGSVPAVRVGAARDVSTEREPPPLWRPAIGVLAFVLAAAWAIPQLSGSSKAIPILPEGVGAVASMPAAPDLRAEATIGRIIREAAPAPVPDLPSPAPTRERTASRAAPPAIARRPAPAPTVVPLPRVEGVMIAGPRRLAVVDGQVVAPGDSIGGRSISRIERDGVTFRDASGSGKEVFVPVRPRKRDPGGL